MNRIEKEGERLYPMAQRSGYYMAQKVAFERGFGMAVDNLKAFLADRPANDPARIAAREWEYYLAEIEEEHL